MGHLFHKAAGLDIVYVPFKGTPETVNGLLTGSVQLIYAANLIVAPLIASGQLRALAKLDRDAPPSMADIPTLADAAGLPALDDISVWLGLVAPKGTPKPIIDKINAEVVKVLGDPAVKEKSGAHRQLSGDQHPEQFAAFIRREADRWSQGDPGNRHQVRLSGFADVVPNACRLTDGALADLGSDRSMRENGDRTPCDLIASAVVSWLLALAGRRAGTRGQLPQPIDQDRRAIPGRRTLRRARPHDRPEDDRGLGTAGGDREPRRRQYRARRPAGRQGGARRLHAADGDRLRR